MITRSRAMVGMGLVYVLAIVMGVVWAKLGIWPWALGVLAGLSLLVMIVMQLVVPDPPDEGPPDGT